MLFLLLLALFLIKNSNWQSLVTLIRRICLTMLHLEHLELVHMQTALLSDWGVIRGHCTSGCRHDGLHIHWRWREQGRKI